MKRLILLSTLFALTACQSTSQTEQDGQGRAWLFMKGAQFDGSDKALPKALSPELDPILKAAQTLQWDRVRVLAQDHLIKYPGNKDGLLLLSLASAGLGDKNRSRFYAELVLKGHPGNAFALNILGLLKKNHSVLPEDHRQALVYFQMAQQAAPQSPIGALNAGYLNLELGHFREARQDFKMAMTKCEDCEEARLGSALANQALGQFDEAKLDIDALLAKNENHPTAQLLLASQSLHLKHEYDESRKILSGLLENTESGSELTQEVRSLMNRMDSMAH